MLVVVMVVFVEHTQIPHGHQWKRAHRQKQAHMQRQGEKEREREREHIGCHGT